MWKVARTKPNWKWWEDWGWERLVLMLMLMLVVPRLGRKRRKRRLEKVSSPVMLGTWRFMTLVFPKQGQGWDDAHQAFTSALAFFFYRIRALPFSQHLPHPSLSHPPFPLFFLHPTHHTCSTFHSHIHSLKSKITGWDQIFIHRIRIPGLLHFNTF